MQLAKKIPFDDPNVLNACRAAYAISNLIILAISFYIKTVVDKKKGTDCPPSPPLFLAQLNGILLEKSAKSASSGG